MESVGQEYVETNILDTWAVVRNHMEEYRSNDSPFRLFLPTFVVDKDSFSQIRNHDGRFEIGAQHVESVIRATSELNKLKKIDLVFLPVDNEGHRFVLTFDLKYGAVTMFDQKKKDKILKKSRIRKGAKIANNIVAEMLHADFGRYLYGLDHIKARNIIIAELEIGEYEWQTATLRPYAGLILMRIMETYMGKGMRNWDMRLDSNGVKLQKKLTVLCKKYAATILMSDCNVLKEQVKAHMNHASGSMLSDVPLTKGPVTTHDTEETGEIDTSLSSEGISLALRLSTHIVQGVDERGNAQEQERTDVHKIIVHRLNIKDKDVGGYVRGDGCNTKEAEIDEGVTEVGDVFVGIVGGEDGECRAWFMGCDGGCEGGCGLICRGYHILTALTCILVREMVEEVMGELGSDILKSEDIYNFMDDHTYTRLEWEGRQLETRSDSVVDLFGGAETLMDGEVKMWRLWSMWERESCSWEGVVRGHCDTLVDAVGVRITHLGRQVELRLGVLTRQDCYLGEIVSVDTKRCLSRWTVIVTGITISLTTGAEEAEDILLCGGSGVRDSSDGIRGAHIVSVLYIRRRSSSGGLYCGGEIYELSQSTQIDTDLVQLGSSVATCEKASDRWRESIGRGDEDTLGYHGEGDEEHGRCGTLLCAGWLGWDWMVRMDVREY
ncbi:hypothetical protein Tco_0638571 [Tanacetum coccineum]